MIDRPFSQKILKKMKTHRIHLSLMTAVSVVALLTVLSPESLATTIDTQLTKVNTLASGGIAKTGLTVGTICSAIVGLFKNSWVIFLSSIGIGVGLTYYLEYLKVWAIP